jgi:hypothetical protein
MGEPGAAAIGTAAMIPLALEFVGIPPEIKVLEIKYVLLRLSAAIEVPYVVSFATAEVIAAAANPGCCQCCQLLEVSCITTCQNGE